MPTPQEIRAAIDLLVSADYDEYGILAAGPKWREKKAADSQRRASPALSKPVRSNAHPFMIPVVKGWAFELLRENGPTSKTSRTWNQSVFADQLYERMAQDERFKKIERRNQSGNSRALDAIYSDYQTEFLS